MKEDINSFNDGISCASDLEKLMACPVCGSEAFGIVYSQCRDVVFGAVEGAWDVQQCSGCGSAFLNPRPSRAAIGLAYKNYYTHSNRKIINGKKTNFIKESILRYIRESYIDEYYRSKRSPLGWLGLFAMQLRPRMRETIDQRFRNLPFPRGASANLLDIGCGNGEFLKIAGEAGWTTYGCDPDPEALEIAAANTPNLRLGGVTAWSEKESHFQAISMNHVIEHLHDPVESLDVCRSMLAPGGLLQIETPNFNSYGREMYRQYWRGLEVPRHFVIFTWQSLQQALEKGGFRVEKIVFRKNFWKQSLLSAKIEAGGFHFDTPPPDSELRLPTDKQVHEAQQNIDRSEWIGLIARKV